MTPIVIVSGGGRRTGSWRSRRRCRCRRSFPEATTADTLILSAPRPASDAVLEVAERAVLDRDAVEATRVVDAVIDSRRSPLSMNPFRSIVIPDAPTITPDPVQLRSWVSTALVVTVCPQVVIGVPPPPVASGATTTTSTSTTTAAKLARSLIRLPPSLPYCHRMVAAGHYASAPAVSIRLGDCQPYWLGRSQLPDPREERGEQPLLVLDRRTDVLGEAEPKRLGALLDRQAQEFFVAVEPACRSRRPSPIASPEQTT